MKVVASPSTGVNTLTGEGLAELLEGDPREVLTDEETRCSGARITERTLPPGPDARLGEITLGTWLAQQ